MTTMKNTITNICQLICYALVAIIYISPSVALADYSYYRSLTINHALSGGSDSANFPMLVSLSDNTLRTVANGGHVQNANGYDIHFFSDAGLTQRIPAERERYDGASGTYVGWVRVPNVSHSVDTVVYLAYGDSEVSSDPNEHPTYGKASVWSSDYIGVWHFGDGSTLSLLDSTGNNYTLTNSGSTPVAGQISGAINMQNGNTLSSGLDLSGSSEVTIEAWYKGTFGVDAKQAGQDLGTNNAYRFSVWSNTSLRQAWGAQYSQSSYTVGANDSWRQYSMVYDGTRPQGSRAAVYSNGSAVELIWEYSPSYVPSSLPTFSSSFSWTTNNTIQWDEFRISTTARSADWILTQYNNQNNPGNIGSPGFYSVGDEQDISGSVSPLIAPTLSSPTDDFNGTPITASLVWNDTNTDPNETNVKVCISTTENDHVSNCDTIAADSISRAASDVLNSALSYNTTYYWSVQAIGDGGSTTTDSDWPTDFSFTTEAEPAAGSGKHRVIGGGIF
jgi:hypothetical protein